MVDVIQKGKYKSCNQEQLLQCQIHWHHLPSSGRQKEICIPNQGKQPPPCKVTPTGSPSRDLRYYYSRRFLLCQEFFTERRKNVSEYYISSNKCSVHQRKTKKHGTVYDVYFRITNKTDMVEHQKKLTGYATKTLAKQAHLEFIQQYCELIPAHLKDKKKDPQKRDLTVGELIPEYIASLPNQNKDSSIYEKKNLYEKFILPYFGSYKLPELTKEELYKWQDRIWASKNPRTNEHYSYNYLLKIRISFAAFLSWCEKRYSYKNYFPEIERPRRRAPQKEMLYWTREEFEQFIQVVDNPTYKMMFMLSFFSGRRKGEILALTPSDFKKNSILFNLHKKDDGQNRLQNHNFKKRESRLYPYLPRLTKRAGRISRRIPILLWR